MFWDCFWCLFGIINHNFCFVFRTLLRSYAHNSASNNVGWFGPSSDKLIKITGEASYSWENLLTDIKEIQVAEKISSNDSNGDNCKDFLTFLHQPIFKIF